jgi:hypothetical protein
VIDKSPPSRDKHKVNISNNRTFRPTGRMPRRATFGKARSCLAESYLQQMRRDRTAWRRPCWGKRTPRFPCSFFCECTKGCKFISLSARDSEQVTEKTDECTMVSRSNSGTPEAQYRHSMQRGERSALARQAAQQLTDTQKRRYWTNQNAACGASGSAAAHRAGAAAAAVPAVTSRPTSIHHRRRYRYTYESRSQNIN